MSETKKAERRKAIIDVVSDIVSMRMHRRGIDDLPNWINRRLDDVIKLLPGAGRRKNPTAGVREFSFTEGGFFERKVDRPRHVDRISLCFAAPRGTVVNPGNRHPELPSFAPGWNGQVAYVRGNWTDADECDRVKKALLIVGVAIGSGGGEDKVRYSADLFEADWPGEAATYRRKDISAHERIARENERDDVALDVLLRLGIHAEEAETLIETIAETMKRKNDRCFSQA
jgi:hypothetical protein